MCSFARSRFRGVLRPERRCPSRVERFALPVVELLDPADDADAAPEDLLRAWVPADVVRLARSPREQGQAASRRRGTRARLRCRVVSRRPSPSNRIFPARSARRRQLERALALEDDEDLLFGGMNVRRAGQHARIAARCASARSSATRPRARDRAACAQRRLEARHPATFTIVGGRPVVGSGQTSSGSRSHGWPYLHLDVARDRPHRPPRGSSAVCSTRAAPNAITSRPSAPARIVCASWTFL